jgi:hypothetical protein
MDRKLARQLGLAVAVLALAGHVRGALALEGYPESACREGLFGGPDAREPNLLLGRVVGKGTARLLSDMDGCPLHPARGKDCHNRRQIISPGILVAVLPSAMPGLTCVLDPGNPDLPTGWLPQVRVQMLPLDRTPPLAAWVGQWRESGDNTIVLTADRDGKLSVNGRAYWPGRGIPPEHTGEISGVAQPEGNRVTFGLDQDPPLCVAWLELLGPDMLAVNDTWQCGGANVTFGGVYTRARR